MSYSIKLKYNQENVYGFVIGLYDNKEGNIVVIVDPNSLEDARTVVNNNGMYCVKDNVILKYL